MTAQEKDMARYTATQRNKPGTIEYYLTHPLYTFVLRYKDGKEEQCDQLRYTLGGAKRFASLLAKNMARHTPAATYADVLVYDTAGRVALTVPITEAK